MGVLYLLVQGLLNYSHFEGQYYPSWNFFALFRIHYNILSRTKTKRKTKFYQG